MALTKVDISLMDNTTGFTIVTKVVTVAASKLVIDGVSQDTLTLTEGYTYKFDTSHATLSGHTVSFATAADAAGSTQYTTGVTTNGTPGNAGAYTQIVVAQSAPVLYYYCANHASMGGITSTPVAVIANKLLAYDGSGNLPAVDGSQLTNPNTGVTNSASDPVITTNPSGGVGTQWNNTTSGEVYICTDATAGANVWTNVGAGTGDVRPWGFPGDTYGYAWGGTVPTNNKIERISFATDGNSTDVADMTTSRGESTGCTTPTYGYSAGGYPWSGDGRIERMLFSTEANATDVGNLTSDRRDMGSCSSETHCYWMGKGNIIERSADASSANAVDVGDATVSYSHAAGSSDPGAGYGYIHGGFVSSAQSVYIERFQMQASANGVDVGDLAISAGQTGGTSSLTHGYNIGTGSWPTRSNTIQKFAFGSSSTGTDVGDLSGDRWGSTGVSSSTHTYSAGGDNAGGGGSPVNIIEKWPHASDTNATDVGDLTTVKNMFGPCGNQY